MESERKRVQGNVEENAAPARGLAKEAEAKAKGRSNATARLQGQAKETSEKVKGKMHKAEANVRESVNPPARD